VVTWPIGWKQASNSPYSNRNQQSDRNLIDRR
jgi:hypothetical protein